MQINSKPALFRCNPHVLIKTRELLWGGLVKCSDITVAVVTDVFVASCFLVTIVVWFSAHLVHKSSILHDTDHVN